MANFNIGDAVRDTKDKDERTGFICEKKFYPGCEEPWYTIDIIQTKTNNMAYKVIRVYGADDWVLCHKKEEFEK